jgi:hypothetical protein
LRHIARTYDEWRMLRQSNIQPCKEQLKYIDGTCEPVRSRPIVAHESSPSFSVKIYSCCCQYVEDLV